MNEPRGPERRGRATTAGAAAAVALALTLAGQVAAGDPVVVPPDGVDLDLPVAPARWRPFDPRRPGTPVDPQAPDPGGEPGDAPPPTLAGEDLDAAGDRIVFVVDRSQAMDAPAEPFEGQDGRVTRSPTRLERAQAELIQAIDRLPESLRFDVVAFDRCAESWSPGGRDATDANKRLAAAFLSAQRPAAAPGRNTYLGLSAALVDRGVETVVLVTGGAPDVLDCAGTYQALPERHAELIRAANLQGARIDILGVGLDAEARAFLARVASEAGGRLIEAR